MSEITYSSSEELKRYAAQQGLRLPTEEAISNPEVPLTKEQDAEIPDQIPDEFKGQYLAEMDKRYGHLGYVMPFEDYKKYKAFMDEKKVSMWKTVGEAVGAATTDLATGAYELAGDVVTLKVPKVVGSGIEGAAVGTKNWLYMYEQAKYDKNSWLSKMLFNNHSTPEDEYLSYQEALKVRQMIHKDQNEGIILPPTINVGGMDLDLTNPAVVQAVSYVADPSWLIPNLGIESAIAKGLRGATAAVGLGENLTKASAFALKKASEGFGKLGDGGEWISSKIAKVDKGVGEVMTDMTGHQHHITGQGKIQGNEGLVRAAEGGLGVNQVTIPAWAKVTMVWGAAKLTEGVGRLGETALKLAAEEPKIAGMTLSERVALESTSKPIQKVATFWAANASPFVQWATNTTKVGFHSSMYGGAFGFAFGGEEGLYHGLGTGFVIGSAFNQIGVLHNTVSGGDAVRDTVKQFLWATSHYDFHNQEGLMRLLENAHTEAGTQGQLSVMSKIAAAERLLPDDPIRILTEKKIKEMSTSAEFDAYERQNLANPEFGGITFLKDKDGKSVILINADRAARSAVSEETFHGLLLTKRYGKAFTKHAVDALVGTENNLGALYRMPKDKAVSLLEQFRDQYFNLDKETGGHTPENMSGMYKKFNEAIERFKGGEKATELNALFEEFLASYWNRFVEDKPLDYLLKGGDLGLVRNAIQGAKDFYRNTMAKDLQEAGVQLIKGDTPDMFLIDQTTKQRVRIPMLERLMKHYVKELGQGMYDGWALNNKKYADNHTLLNSDFDHLIKTDIESGSMTKKTEAEVNKEMSARIAGLADELMALPASDRGLKLELMNEQGESIARYQPAKPKKKPKKEVLPEATKPSDVIDVNKERAWFLKHRKKLAETGVTASDLAELGPKKGGKPRKVEREVGDGRWSLEKTGDFWESFWQGNPRVRITGLATPKELSLFEQYLGKATATRLRELNLVIETSRVGRTDMVSNIVRSTVITMEKSTDDGREKGYFIEQRRFVPVELNMYFQTKPKGKPKDGIQKYTVGEAKLLVQVFDWDAYLRREDFIYNKIDDGDLHYKGVRNLFTTQQNLREAVKALLSNYSLGNHAEAGLKLFSRGKGGERDAALKRDIVNAVIGYHPTKEMAKKRRWKNTPLDFQMRDAMPETFTVMKNFRVDRMSKIVAENGEGFRYDHNEAYKRSQANFSPAITRRDNNGNIIPYGAGHIIKDTVYRNKEGEHIAVYALRTPSSEIQVRTDRTRVFDYVDDGLADKMEFAIPSLRGSQYTSKNGWLHFTPDIHEAGFFEDKQMRVGYIDSQSHLDISDIPFGTDMRTAVDMVSRRIAETTGTPVGKVMEDMLRMKDESGNRIFDLFQRDTDAISSSMPTMDEWLMTATSKKLFRDYGIESVGYMNHNPISGHEYSSVAILESRRFVENRQVKGANDFMFQPAKTIADKYREQVKRAGSDDITALLKYKIDDQGNVVPRTKFEQQITEKSLTDTINFNQTLVDDALKYLKDEKVFTTETHKRFKEAMTPRMVRVLKEKFQDAPLEVLEQIAQYSMDGFASYVQSVGSMETKLIAPFGRETYIPKVSITADSALIENASKYGITPKTLAETGIPSLGHWVEMSEAEYMALKNYKKWGQLYKEVEAGKKEEANMRVAEVRKDMGGLTAEQARLIRQGISDKASISEAVIARVLRENQGIAGLIDNMAERQKQLVFLADASILGTGRLGDDNLVLSTYAKNKMMKAFMERNIGFAKTLIKTDRGYARKDMMEIVNAYEAVVASKRNIAIEADEARAIWDRQTREVDNIISDDAKQRIMDFLSAYHIKDINPDVLDKIRAKLYDESAKGFIELGTPEAIARSVELYAFYDSGGKESLAKIRESIKRNYIESINRLEKEGFYGVRWKPTDISKTNGVIAVHENGVVKNVQRAWNFDGTHLTVLETQLAGDTKRTLAMYDKDGNILSRKEYKFRTEEVDKKTGEKSLKDVPLSVIDETVELFLQEATQTVRNKIGTGDIPAQQLIEGPYQEVKGNMKNLILAVAKQSRGTGEVSSDKFRLFRNGDYFLAQEIFNAEMGYDVGAKIKQLEEQLASGKANATRPITEFERTKLEERLQKVDEILRDNKFGSVERMEQLQAEQASLSEQLDSGVKKSDKLDKKKELTIDEKVKLRDEITRLKRFKNQDLGFSFIIDKKYGAEIITTQFGSLKERNAELARMATNKGRNSSEAFEKFAESSFKNFNQFINGLRLTEMNRLGTLLAEGTHADSIIPQIKKLMAELNEVEKQQRGFYRNEKTRINNELRLKGKKPLEESKIIERIKSELDEIELAADEAEAMHLAAAVQLHEMKVLDKMKGFSPERVEELMYRISAKSKEIDFDEYRMAVPRDGNVVGMIEQLQRSFIENGNKFAVLQDKWTQMHDGLYGRDEDLSGIKGKIDFLSKRYLQAKGIKVTAERSFIEAAKLHDFDVVSKFDFNKLRTSRPQGKGVTYGEPSYLVDVDNVLGKGHEYHRTVKDYTEEFKARLINLKNYYDAGISQGDISIKNILGIELTPANTDISIHHHLRNKLTEKNLGEAGFRWANEPKNRDFIKKLDTDIMEGRIDHNEAVQMIKDEELLSSLGKDGIALKDTVKALDETVEKIAIVANRLNLAHRGIELVDMNTDIQSEFPFFRQYRAEIPKDIPRLEAELKKLRGQKEALKSRYEKILKKAGDENAPAEFKRLVAEYKQLDYQETIARRNTKQDRQRLREIEKLRKSSITKLFRQYDDFARNLGLKNIKDSRVEINPADPSTQYIAYSFPEISSDLFQSSWRQWDLSTSYTEGTHNAGVISGNDAPSSTIGGEQRNFVRQDARNSKRPVFLADYIHFAHAKRAYHEKNPSMPMSAADAHLIKFFFPRESANGLLADKINRVPEEKMKQHEAFTNGIMDNLKTATEKERFVRSFVVDALDLITDNAGIREVALKKLKQMSDAEFKQWREENPDAVDRSLNTIEVLEQAMYLMKNGVVPVGTKGEKFNFRDSIHTTLSKDDIARIYAIAEKKGWSEEQVQKYIDAGVSDVTPKELRPILARKKSPFATRSDIGHLPIDTLVRMQGFMDIWKQEVARHTEDSLFGIERNYSIKQMYENLPPQERFNLDMPTITQMMKDNERSNIQAARETKKRYKQKNKAILDDASLEQFSFGQSDTIIKDEWARINHILAEALSTEASLIKYKRDAQGFISTRPFALDNLLSMKDNLRITDLRKHKDGSTSIDWDNKNKPNFRDTIDGRYFIKREVTTDKKGKTGERFTIFFKGERFNTPSGQKVHEIPTTRFASTDNLTEAQVMIRLFEDDVMRVKRAADMIEGGKTKFDEFRVGEQSLPTQDPRQGLLINWSNAGHFSEQVLNLYMENKGKPFFRQLMADKLEGIGQYGEKGYLVWDANGRTRTKSMLITPQKEGIISKYFEQRRSKDGHQLWVRRKSDKPVVDPNAATEENATTQGQALKTEEARSQSPEEKTVSDVSNFDIIQSSGPSTDKPFEDWVIVRNRLKYTIIKIDDKGRSIFRIFNPASVFMAETYHEYEAVEEILKQEMKQYE